MKSLLKLSLFLFISLATLNSCKRDTSSVPLENASKDEIIFHKLTINGNETIIKEVGGKYYFSDDEGLSERQFNILKRLANTKLGTIERSTIITDLTKKWPGGIWYYTIQSNRSSDIFTAMSWISAVANIQFVQRTNQTNYVTFYDTTDLASGSTTVGMESGPQQIYISTTQGTGSIAHEIMHSLGFFHEHSRPDRDIYVRVHDLPNDNQVRYNYNIAANSQGVGPFDFESIMLYGPDMYLEKIDGSGWPKNRSYLSDGDKQGLAALYGAKITGPDQICAEGTFTSSGAITIDNASGIATITSLGNNQWKVTRIGNANGKITLNSTNSYKKIFVGSYNDILYYGGNKIEGGVSTGMSAEVSDPNATYNWLIFGGIIVSGQGTPNVVVKPDRNNFNADNNFELRLIFSNSCGSSTISKQLWVPHTEGESFDPGDGEILP